MKLKSFILSVLIFILTISSLSIITSAEGEILQGSCGENTNYVLSSDYVLTITGNGTISDFSATSYPWQEYSSQITKVIISEGITKVPNNAFINIKASFTLSDSILTIAPNSIGYKYEESEYIKIEDTIISARTDTAGEKYALASSFTFNEIEDIDDTPLSYSGSCGEELTYTLTEDGTLTITGTGDMYDFSKDKPSPWHDQYDVKKVVLNSGVLSIGSYAFYNMETITEVIFNSDLSAIYEYAFYGCKSLKSITFPANFSKLGAYAFASCELIESIRLPSSLNDLGVYCFKDCKSLSSLQLPSSVKYIPEGMFMGCTSLSEFPVTDKIESIDKFAFLDCTSLTSVLLSYKVRYIGEFALGYVTQDTGYLISAVQDYEIISYTPSVAQEYAVRNNLKFTEYDKVESDNGIISDDATWRFSPLTGVLNIMGTGEMPDYLSFENTPYRVYRDYIKQVTFASGITKIGDNSFNGCVNLNTITFSKTISLIGNSAFKDTSVEVLEFPFGISEIGDSAFENCIHLTGVKLSSGLKTIGENAFKGNLSLLSIYIPENVITIGQNAIGYSQSNEIVQGFVIEGISGSIAESYANQSGISFVQDGYVELTDKASGAIVSVPGNKENEYVFSFKKFPNMLEPDVLLASGQNAIKYSLEILLEGEKVSISAPTEISIPIPKEMQEYIVNLYAVYEGDFIEINYQKTSTHFVFDYTGLGEFVISNVDLTDLKTIKVNYLYENGTAALDSTTVRGTVGAAYSFIPDTIYGYDADNTSINGIIGSNDIELTVTYKKKPQSEDTTKPVEKNPKNDDSSNNTWWIIIIIILVIVISAVVALFVYYSAKKKKKSKETKATIAAVAKKQTEQDKLAKTMVVPDFATRELNIESLFADDPEEDIDAEDEISKK